MGCASGKQRKVEPEWPVFHGVLYAIVHHAKNLPNTKGGCCSGIWFGDVYAVIQLGHYTVMETSTIKNEWNPRWEELFRVDVCHPCNVITLKVKEENCSGKDDFLGQVNFQVENILGGQQITGSHQLLDKRGKLTGAEIDIELWYKSVETLSLSSEVPDCYFSLRAESDVRLYQDAHTCTACACSALHGDIILASGESYKPRSAWEDIYYAIDGAQKFIYITAWAMDTRIILLKEKEGSETVGQLLKRKANEGVHVLIMLWDEKLSTEITPGLMGTRDEKTQDFFGGSKVELMLVERQSTGFLPGLFVSTVYTHHQKTISVDTAGPKGGKRRIVSFLGGLDLHTGRRDTSDHDLYQDEPNHKKPKPKEPFHDIHCRLEGPAAFDIIQNFTERWHKQLSRHDDLLYHISENEFDLNATSGPNEWNVQVFRSIDEDSAIFDPDRKLGIIVRNKRATDSSIQRAYIHHIRRASNFIYIENQYFWGSSNFWLSPNNKIEQLVPVEITTKICQKIKANERFVAYIVIPLHPDEDPEGMVVQEMLYWQRCTMEMMYTRIANEINRLGISAKPTDYLSFYCLGNRDTLKPNTSSKTHHRRSMVYVHSKVMICDDEYAIVGSANTNQRSMDGNRDTEIAVGMEQRDFTMKTAGGLPRGLIHGFRMSLWAEHLARVEEIYLQPASLECIWRVNQLAKLNWDIYASDNAQDMTSHLMQYPVQITGNGAVKELPGHKNFPATEAHILGKKSAIIPDVLTT